MAQSKVNDDTQNSYELNGRDHDGTGRVSEGGGVLEKQASECESHPHGHRCLEAARPPVSHWKERNGLRAPHHTTPHHTTPCLPMPWRNIAGSLALSMTLVRAAVSRQPVWKDKRLPSVPYRTVPYSQRTYAVLTAMLKSEGSPQLGGSLYSSRNAIVLVHLKRNGLYSSDNGGTKVWSALQEVNSSTSDQSSVPCAQGPSLTVKGTAAAATAAAAADLTNNLPPTMMQRLLSLPPLGMRLWHDTKNSPAFERLDQLLGFHLSLLSRGHKAHGLRLSLRQGQLPGRYPTADAPATATATARSQAPHLPNAVSAPHNSQRRPRFRHPGGRRPRDRDGGAPGIGGVMPRLRPRAGALLCPIPPVVGDRRPLTHPSSCRCRRRRPRSRRHFPCPIRCHLFRRSAAYGRRGSAAGLLCGAGAGGGGRG